MSVIRSLSGLLGFERGNAGRVPVEEENQRTADEAKKLAAPPRILVTGAAGQTGRLVLRRLLQMGVGPGCQIAAVRGMVRSEESKEDVKQALSDVGTKELELVVGDIADSASLLPAFADIDTVIVLTSAKPNISKVSLAGMIALKLVTFGSVVSKPSFWFDERGTPEQVDWLGQKAQFDAAVESGVKHVVLVSSMCGTKPDHFLNTQMDNMVLWKRKVSVDDRMSPEEGAVADGPVTTTVPREDLAEVCIQCSLQPQVAAGVSFDLCSGREGEGTPFDGSLSTLLAQLNGQQYTYTEADKEFCAMPDDKGRGLCCH